MGGWREGVKKVMSEDAEGWVGLKHAAPDNTRNHPLALNPPHPNRAPTCRRISILPKQQVDTAVPITA